MKKLLFKLPALYKAPAIYHDTHFCMSCLSLRCYVFSLFTCVFSLFSAASLFSMILIESVEGLGEYAHER